MRKLIHLRSSRDGTAAIEIAMLAPVLLLFITGFFELGYIALARSTLESATLEAARSAVATRCPDARLAKITALINSKMQSISAHNNEAPTIVIRSYGTGGFGNVGNPEPFTDKPPNNGKWDTGESYTDVNGNGIYDTDMGVEGSAGGPGQVVSYNTSFKVPSLMPMIAKQINGGLNYYEIDASTSVRNEPVFKNTGC